MVHLTRVILSIYNHFRLSHTQGKVQKHQAFEAEVAANEDRVATTIKVGRGKAKSSY